MCIRPLTWKNRGDSLHHPLPTKKNSARLRFPSSQLPRVNTQRFKNSVFNRLFFKYRVVACEVRVELGLLCIIGCPVQLIREVFSRLHLCRHTFALLWRDCFCFASLWRANSRGDSCVLGFHIFQSQALFYLCWGLLFVYRKAYIFQEVCWRSTIDLCLLNLPTRSTPWVKFHFGLSLHIFQNGSLLSLENVCDSCCMHQWNRVV